VLMTLNLGEFPAIENLARSYGVKFRLDAAIFPTLAGDQSPVDLRVSRNRRLPLSSPIPTGSGNGMNLLIVSAAFPAETACMSARRQNHLSYRSQGWLYPCLMVRAPRYSLLNGGFLTGWNGDVSRIGEETAEKDFPAASVSRNSFAATVPDFSTWKTAGARFNPRTCAPWADYAMNTFPKDLLEDK